LSSLIDFFFKLVNSKKKLGVYNHNIKENLVLNSIVLTTYGTSEAIIHFPFNLNIHKNKFKCNKFMFKTTDKK
jgi:hypothetical protein